MANPHTETSTSEHAQDATHASATVPAHGSEPKDPLAVDGKMVGFTWLVFAVLLVILYKFAFKPILSGLDAREGRIRNAMDEADDARKQLEQIESTRDSLIAEADDKAKDIVADSRKAADEAARVIKAKAHEDAQIMLENAEREIQEAENRARSELRKQSAEMAITLAGKIVGENLDNDRNRLLTDKLISEI